MNTDDLRKKWNHLATDDPLWAILTESDKRGKLWVEDDFFATGVWNTKQFLDLARHHHPGLRFGSALDFGCGVGRLTLALGAYFEQVVGVDISDEMIAQAEKRTTSDKIQYRVNHRDDLSLFPDGSFDFILSHIVLQHTPPAIHQRYIREFVRTLKPEGVGLFQLPAPFPEDWGSSAYDPAQIEKIEMYGTEREEVVRLLEDAGARILVAEEDGSCGPEHPSYRYLLCKA